MQLDLVDIKDNQHLVPTNNEDTKNRASIGQYLFLKTNIAFDSRIVSGLMSGLNLVRSKFVTLEI